MDIGAGLKKARKKAGITQEELAFRLNSTQDHISKIENNVKKPTLVMFFNIAESLELDPKLIIDYILEGN